MHNRQMFKSKVTLLAFAIMVVFNFTYSTHAGEGEPGTITGVVKAKKAKYLRDSLVYIENVQGTFEPPKEHAVMDQKNMAFIPHVLPLIKGTTVDFLNSDPVLHNIYSPDAVADNVNLGTWLKGEARSYTFNKLGVASFRCNVHVDMLAYILILQNPFYSRLDNEGRFSIHGLPEGKYTVKLWNERRKAVDKQVEVKAGAQNTVEFELK